MYFQRSARLVTSIRFTTPSPSNRFTRDVINALERPTSRAQWRSSALIFSVPSWSSDAVVTRSMVSPTAALHARQTLPFDSGWFRSNACSAEATQCCAAIMLRRGNAPNPTPPPLAAHCRAASGGGNSRESVALDSDCRRRGEAHRFSPASCLLLMYHPRRASRPGLQIAASCRPADQRRLRLRGRAGRHR